LPVTESVSGRLLRLPFYYDLKKEEQAEIVQSIKKFLEGDTPSQKKRRK